MRVACGTRSQHLCRSIHSAEIIQSPPSKHSLCCNHACLPVCLPACLPACLPNILGTPCTPHNILCTSSNILCTTSSILHTLPLASRTSQRRTAQLHNFHHARGQGPFQSGIHCITGKIYIEYWRGYMEYKMGYIEY